MKISKCYYIVNYNQINVKCISQMFFLQLWREPKSMFGILLVYHMILSIGRRLLQFKQQLKTAVDIQISYQIDSINSVE